MQGPDAINRIYKELLEELELQGYDTINSAFGTYYNQNTQKT